MNKKICSSLVALLLGLACQGYAGDEIFEVPVGKNEIKIMSYNVENLFDAVHDENKNDYEFLPRKSPLKKKCDQNRRNANYCRKLDWTKSKVALKIRKLKEAMVAQGDLPDVLGLVEVENPAVIGQLAKELGYSKYVMTNSPDNRGIDCAYLYRSEKLKLVEFLERKVEKSLHPTRSLSFAIFQTNSDVGNNHVGVSMNHWPSQGGPTPVRLVVAEDFVEFMGLVSKKYEKQNIQMVVMGDFNTLTSESPNPLEDVLLSKKNPVSLLDAHELAVREKNPYLSQMPHATYYYGVNNEWNEFDHIFVSKNLKDGQGLELDSHSFRIHAPEFMTKQNSHNEKIPMRYSHETEDPDLAGYSDHFGVLVKLTQMN